VSGASAGRLRSAPLAVPVEGPDAAQIVRTYLRITGKTGQSGSIVEQFAVSVGASLADPMVAKLVSPETFLDLLRDGKPSNVLSEDAPSVGGLSSEALKNLWRVYANSELGIARFFLVRFGP
jgi:hypothetical protein